MYRSLVVAYDGSDGARAALGQAVDIATGQGSALTLVWSVHEKSALELTPLKRADPGEAADARKALDEVAHSLGADLAAAPWVTAGPAGAAVLAVAEDVEADLIVTGSRGRGRVARAVLGSVSSELVRGAACDVLVVHPREA